MNKYSKQVKVIEKNIEISDAEKISALSELLQKFENESTTLENNYKDNFLKNENKKSRFYWWQMIATVLAGLVTMSTATKSLETNDILTINNLICAISGTITGAGIGSMVLEEMGVPIFKEDRQLLNAKKMKSACTEIRKILNKLETPASQTQPE